MGKALPTRGKYRFVDDTLSFYLTWGICFSLFVHSMAQPRENIFLCAGCSRCGTLVVVVVVVLTLTL